MANERKVTDYVAPLLFFIEKEYKSYIEIAKYLGVKVSEAQDSLGKLERLGYVESKFLGDWQKLRSFKLKSGVINYELCSVIRRQLSESS